MRNKFKALGKKTQVLLITLTIVITAFLSPIFVKTVTAGEIDIFQMVSTLLGKVENQDDKIANLENEIDKLKEQIEQQKPDPVVEEKEEEPKTDPVVEVKPEEPKPAEPKPADPKPVAPKPAEPKPVEPTEPKLQVYLKESALKLIWTKDTSTNFQGYKIVISKADSTPSYPDNGYMTFITDRYTTYWIVDNSSV